MNINSYAVAPTHAEVLKHGKQRELTQAYLASISFVDSCVGRVVDALRTSPHAKNTYVVLWSDHGFHLGEKKHWAGCRMGSFDTTSQDEAESYS